MTSSRGSARFIGPKATSSKTVSVTCDSWVAGFWKPMPMRWLSSMHRPGVDVLAVERDRAPDLAADRPWVPVRCTTRQSVVLPASEAPARPTTSPSRSSRSMSSSAGRAAPA